MRARARELRRSSTDAEALLWSRLRGRRLLGLKFRRQHPIRGYFADFACLELGLVIELDGGQHAAPQAAGADARRSAELATAGFQVLRFWNHDVLQDTEAVMQQIFDAAQTTGRAVTHPLPHKAERPAHKDTP